MCMGAFIIDFFYMFIMHIKYVCELGGLGKCETYACKFVAWNVDILFFIIISIISFSL